MIGNSYTKIFMTDTKDYYAAKETSLPYLSLDGGIECTDVFVRLDGDTVKEFGYTWPYESSSFGSQYETMLFTFQNTVPDLTLPTV